MRMFRNWAALNKFSDDDLAIDDRTRELQRKISRFEQTYYTISIAYWSIWLAALLSGNAVLTRVSSFSVFCWAMLASSFSFCLYFLARLIKDIQRPHELVSSIEQDASGFNRYSWRTLFWLGFVLFYLAPTSQLVMKYLGSFGTVMCFYGLILVASSALLIKTWTFMGDPNIPMNLITVGPYSLLRHPQALGNLLFVSGFALTGGSLWSAAAFVAAGFLYGRNIVPLEEQMLSEAFPNSYSHYAERVPRFSGALILLLVIQTAMMMRYGVGAWS